MSDSDELSNNNNMLEYLNDKEKKMKVDLQYLLKSKLKKYGKDEILVLISICYQCEKYEDVITCFEELYLQYNELYLPIEQLQYLEIGFKSIITQKQKQLNKLKNLLDYSQENNNNNSEENKGLISGINFQSFKIEQEMKDYCLRIIKLIDTFIIKNISEKINGINRELESFLYKIKGDSCKYLILIEKNDDIKNNYLKEAKNHYKNCIYVCNKYLYIANRIYLNCILSYLKFLIFFGNGVKEAKNIINDYINKDEIKDIQNNTEKPEHKIIEEIIELKNYIEKKEKEKGNENEKENENENENKEDES